jgi:hypothetical protein
MALFVGGAVAAGASFAYWWLILSQLLVGCGIGANLALAPAFFGKHPCCACMQLEARFHA